jgi:ABC-2 type transport system ATP-binding protein
MAEKEIQEISKVIQVRTLVKEFMAKHKEAGLIGSFKSLIAPKYKRVAAVDGIDLDVKEGELLAFIGPNGAGKSTTLKMLTGILYPTSGYLDVLGFNPQKQRKKLAFHIGTVFGQKPQMWYHLPPIDTFDLFSKIFELDKKEYKKRLAYLIKMFAIEPFLHTPVRKLSLGQRMRCELVASLLHKPKVLFLDEPTIGLDIIAKKRIRELIKKLNKEEKLTIILTSHDMEDVERICERLVIINHGKIVYDGSVKDIRERYLKYKIVNVLFEEEVKSLKVPHTKVVEKSGYEYKLEVDILKYPMKKLLAYLMATYQIEDIIISDPPIEEIIERIYRGKV